eukprot:gb/GECG01006995.1/.p1 GENE.gb/GECG01006995.1/~~gb/GECG01006995.1/.p1  ORF type:complete len:1988 (+),score=202.50 gb/GECG01006995.1/:1-5964(+)
MEPRVRMAFLAAAAMIVANWHTCVAAGFHGVKSYSKTLEEVRRTSKDVVKNPTNLREDFHAGKRGDKMYARDNRLGVQYETLQDGTPASDTLIRNETAYYRFAIDNSGDSFDHAEIYLTSFTGDGDLYVLLSDAETSQSPPGPYNANYASRANSQRDYVIIRKGDNPFNDKCSTSQICYALIAVIPFDQQEVSYNIVAALAGIPIELIGGEPHVDHVLADQCDKYWYNQTIKGSEITFTLTPFSGDPDIFVSTVPGVSNTTDWPDSHHYDWASRYTDRDVVHVFNTDDEYCDSLPCYYGICVYAAQGINSAFSIMVSESNETKYLVDGQTQVDTVKEKDLELYRFYAPVTAKKVIITVQPWAGDPDLYVNVGPNLPHPGPHTQTNFSSLHGRGTEEISIDTTTSAYKWSCGQSRCLIQIGVHGFSWAGYFITATANNFRRLAEGVSVEGSVPGGTDKDNFEYFYFQNTEHDATLLFSLTALSGDPDLFISTGNGNSSMLPTFWSAEWKSLSLGSDVIEIQTKFDKDSCRNKGGEDCSYWVGVASGTAPASFSIVVSTEADSSVTLLTDGQPVTDFANESLSNMYRFVMPALQENKVPSVEFSITPQFGDPDLYVRLNNSKVSKKRDGYDYRSNSANGPEGIVVRYDDNVYPHACGNGKHCDAWLRVYGFSATKYSIVATLSSSAMRLEDGVAVSASVSKEKYQHYEFVVDDPTATLRVTVTPLSGDPDLFINAAIKDSTTFPLKNESMWASAGIGLDAVTILQPNDITEKCFKGGSSCLYLISVYGYSASSSSFTIQASTGVQQLTSGEPQTGTIGPSEFVYFRFRLPPEPVNNGASVTVSLSRIAGNTELYITNALENGSHVFPELASMNRVVHYKWSTESSSSRDAVTIHPYDSQPPDAWTPGRDYIVGVLGSRFRLRSEFALTYEYANNGSIRRLQDGVTIRDQVGSEEYNYYSIEVPESDDELFLSVTPFYGDPDLYVSVHSDNTHPTKEKNDFRQQSGSQDNLYLTRKDLNQCQQSASGGSSGSSCMVYISIYGFRSSRYSLLGTTLNGAPVTLYDGVPQSSHVRKGAYVHFVANLGFTQKTEYSIYVTPDFGDPDLFVNTISPHFPKKDFNEHDFASTSLGEESVRVVPGDPRYVGNGTARISVYGFDNCSFTIQWVSKSEVQQLQEGVAVQGSVSGGLSSYSRFRFEKPPNAPEDVIISLSPRSGDATFYVSNDTIKKPTRSQYTWKASSLSNHVLFVPGSYSTESVNYNIAVSSENQEATFSLIAVRNNTFVRLTDGSPQSNAVREDHCRMYYITTDLSHRNLTVSASPLTTSSGGDVRIAVSRHLSNQWPPLSWEYPTLANFTWSSKSGARGAVGRHSVAIDFTDDKRTPSLARYLIGVCAVGGDVLFSTSASTDDIELVLQPGIPTSKLTVSAGNMFRFRVQVTNTSNDLTLLLTPFAGWADIVMSRRSRPECSISNGGIGKECNATWGTTKDNSRESGPDILRVQHGAPCSNSLPTSDCSKTKDWTAGWFNIGVFGLQQTVFTLSAFTRGLTILRDGEPQVSQALFNVPSYMTFGVAAGSNFQKHPIKFTVSRLTADGNIGLGGMPLHVYLQSCRSDRCSSTEMYPNSNHNDQDFFVLSASEDFYITPDEGSLYCTPDTDNSCSYFLGIEPLSLPGNNGNGSTTFQVTAEVLGDSSVTSIAYERIHNRRASDKNIFVQKSAKNYELYLAPDVQSDGRLWMGVDACSQVQPVLGLYVCDPSPQSGKSPCKDPYNPSSGDNTYENKTLDGVSTLLINDSDSKFVVASVQNHDSSGATYEFFATVGPTWILSARNGVIQVSFNDELEAKVKWEAPQFLLYSSDNVIETVTAKNVSFKVYYTKGRFEDTKGTISSTACGIEYWSEQARESAVSVRGSLEAAVQDIQAHTSYEFAVLAVCDEGCWNETLPELRQKSKNHIIAVDSTFSVQKNAIPTLSYEEWSKKFFSALRSSFKGSSGMD